MSGPYLDEHLFEYKQKGILFRFYKKILLDEQRAEKSAGTTHTLFTEAFNMAFQPRVAFIYWIAFILNWYLAFKKCETVTLYVSAVPIMVVLLRAFSVFCKSRKDKPKK